MAQLPPQLQQKIMELQNLQQRAEAFKAQRMQLKVKLEETEKALTELEELEDPDAIVYKTIGAILIKANKDKLKEELADQKETLDMRIKTVERQAEKTSKYLEDLQKEVQETIKQAQMGGLGGGFKGPM